MDFENKDNRDEVDDIKTDSSIETVLVTQSKNEGVRNELSLKLRDTNVSVRGWKACAVETIGVGLMIAGLFFVSMHGKDVAKSLGSVLTKSINR